MKVNSLSRSKLMSSSSCTAPLLHPEIFVFFQFRVQCHVLETSSTRPLAHWDASTHCPAVSSHGLTLTCYTHVTRRLQEKIQNMSRDSDSDISCHIQNMSGTCQEHVRNMSGTCQEHVRNMSGTCQEHVRNMSGTCQEHVRNMSGTCEEHVRNMWGTCQEHVRNMSGTCQEHSEISIEHNNQHLVVVIQQKNQHTSKHDQRWVYMHAAEDVVYIMSFTCLEVGFEDVGRKSDRPVQYSCDAPGQEDCWGCSAEKRLKHTAVKSKRGYLRFIRSLCNVIMDTHLWPSGVRKCLRYSYVRK